MQPRKSSAWQPSTGASRRKAFEHDVYDFKTNGVGGGSPTRPSDVTANGQGEKHAGDVKEKEHATTEHV